MAEEATRTSSRRDALSRLGVAMPGPSHDPEEAAARVSRQLWAASRAVLGVVLVVGGLVAPDLTPVFWVLLVLRMLLVGTALRWHPTRRQQVLTTPLDIALATGLLLTSGGSDSPLVIALIGLPVIGGYLVRTRLVVLIGAGTALTATLASLPHLLEGRPGAPRELLALLLVLAFSTLAGVGFTLGRRELARRTAEVDDARRRLLHAGLGAEDRERRRVSHDLHGEALQVLLAAAQDLDEEDPEGLRRARAGIRSAVLAIRETVRDLHPAALRHAGLQASVRAALEHRVHDVVGVRVEADADGVREALLLSVVRELGDALAQAGVDEAVAARVSRGPGAVVLAVSATAGRDAVERLRGTLAGVAERVEADGGTLALETGLDGRAVLSIRLSAGPAPVAGAVEPVDDDRLLRQSRLLFSCLCLSMVPFGTAAALLDGEPGAAFAGLVTVAAIYHVCVAISASTGRWPQVWSLPMVLATMVVFAAAIAAQGGLGTTLPAFALTSPFVLVLAFRPRDAVIANVVLALALALALGPEVLDGEPDAGRHAALLAAALLWAAVSSQLLAAGRQRMRERLAGLAQARRRVLHDSLAAADAERRRLSDALHDGALQELMIAGQELDQAIDGDREALIFARVALAACLEQLRDTVAELHPPALEHGGLRPALTAVLERACKRGTLRARTEVDPTADGLCDELLVALVRELVTNVAKHARAEHVEVTVQRKGSWIELVVADDGIGTTQDRLASAVAEGHIGLASARERAEAEGGELHVTSRPGGGTRVVAHLRCAPEGVAA